MVLYDDYFTNEDKPFAENLNDALLLSNVFDMTVDVEAPLMFSNSTWVSTTSPRKCGVSILTLKEGLPSGVSVGTDSSTGNSTLTGTGTVKLSWYPNFNSFGKFKAITWENTGTIVVNLKTTNGTTIASNISKGTIENQSSELRTLQEIVIELVFTNATLKSLTVTMENKQENRYGATVGITDVTGLDNRLDNIESDINNIADVIYPIGSIYMSVNSTSPQTLFGGTWERLKDKFLISAGDTYSAGTTGGSADAVVVSHNHTQNAHTHTQNSHSHSINSDGYSAVAVKGDNWAYGTKGQMQMSSGNYYYPHSSTSANGIVELPDTAGATATNQNTTATNNATGEDGTGKNMPPYLAVNVWKRTA